MIYNITIDKSLYNDIYATKLENEQLIEDFYSSFDNFTAEEKMAAIEIIYNLKIINEEYEKYIVIYNNEVQPEVQSNEHIICYGETLQYIAAKETGDFNNWKKIMEFNQLSDINLIVGDVLLIPRDL